MEAQQLTRERISLGVGIGFLAVSLLCLSPSFFWLGELACGFRWHLGWIGLLTLIPVLVHKHRLLAFAVGLLSIGHLYPEGVLYFGSTVESGIGQGAGDLKLASANLRWSNEDRSTPLAWIRAEEADVLALLEVTQPWLPLLEELKELYPYQLLGGSDELWVENTWGIALLSRLPFVATRKIPLPKHDLPLLEAVVVHAGRSLTLRTTHPMRPGSPERIAQRNLQLRSLIGLDWNEPVVLLGDLNVTTYTPSFRELCAETGLRDSRAGFGRQPSFHFGEYFGVGSLFPLSLAIDHILLSSDFEVRGRYRGPHIGSDHVPIVCRIAFAER